MTQMSDVLLWAAFLPFVTCEQGNDGNIRKFTINSTPLDTSLFPRAHTCFNRIDLPLYKSKKDLKQNLSLAIQLESTGFDLE